MNPKSHGTVLCNSIYPESEKSGLSLCSNDNEHFHEEKAYQTTQGILGEYKHAGRKRRYDMWFMFRGLREKFDETERAQHKNPDLDVFRWFRLV